MGHAAEHDLTNPGPLPLASGTKNLLILLGVIGVASFAGGLMMGDAKEIWSVFLINHFYFMSLALGGVFIASIQWLTSAMWSAPIRRVSESFTDYLKYFVPVSTLGVFIGIGVLYHWSHPEAVKGDMILEGKAGYLNVGFFIVRAVVALGVLTFFTHLLIKNSVAQDETKDYGLSLKNKGLSAPFLIMFGILFTMLSFDQLMSLDPHWFSTMFGVYCFAGLFYSSLALTCIMTIYLRRKGLLAQFVNENHLHDLGKFMFAFTVFWAYIGFSQFMLIWYANLPEETGYMIRRVDPNTAWLGVSAFLLFGKFMIPFFALIRRGSKRNETRLLIVGAFMLIAQWIDLVWVVQPEFFAKGPQIGLFSIGMTLGFIGIFGLLMFMFLSKNNVVAIGDPRLKESVFHHHQ